MQGREQEKPAHHQKRDTLKNAERARLQTVFLLDIQAIGDKTETGEKAEEIAGPAAKKSTEGIG